jgi:hypothetical protein
MAITSMVLGIVGLLCFGIVVGPVAMVLGFVSRSRIAKDPSLKGEGMALAGIIIGGIALVLSILAIVLLRNGRMTFGSG